MMNASRTVFWSIALWSIALTPIPALPASATPSDDPGAPPPVLPLVTITHDDTVLTESCRVVIPAGTVIPDEAGDGVIQIRTDGITVEFAPGPDGSPSSLAGAVIDDNWDTLTGVGVRVEHASGVTLRNLRVHGYKVGVLATHADGLTIESADLSDNYRQRLKSTPLREDPTDWLFPHDNDERQWVTQHGAALCVERSENITVRALRVRRGQNGIILDRVNKSKIYDNDCSFLSGWGLACWRSSWNLISRNAFDFCVRGHSEGVYNRGQDSAGILFFEQCNNNTVVENSATHSGDGFFGFAGREAIGQTAEKPNVESPFQSAAQGGALVINTPSGFRTVRRGQGCNGNYFGENDFSYAPAHGWEMTFSDMNTLAHNRIVGNGICGVWGGYSSNTSIRSNHFEANGTLAYGDEGGAINIEHGSSNFIRGNTFTNNSVVLRLWWDDDGSLFDLPGTPSKEAKIADNGFYENRVFVTEDHPFTRDRHRTMKFRGLWYQDPTCTHFGENYIQEPIESIDVANWIGFDFEEGTEPTRYPRNSELSGWIRVPQHATLGTTRPVGARDHLRGRHNIIMGEWGPWDHESPLVRVRERTASRHVYEIFGLDAEILESTTKQPFRGIATRFDRDDSAAPPRWTTTIEATEPGLHPYETTLAVPGSDFVRTFTGTLIDTVWHARTWAWTADPLTDLDAWRAEAEGDRVVHTVLDALDFYYQSRSPADLGMLEREAATNAGITRDKFATIATTTIPLTPGSWTIRTLSDDGIRVFIDGEVVIERWDIHGPTPDTATFAITERRDVEIRVEHFENDGWAALQVTLEPAD
jgi:hypothetical protein